MRVYVNNVGFQIFRGARAKHAILRFLSRHELKPEAEEFEIRDEWSNRIEDDYEMHQDSKIFIK